MAVIGTHVKGINNEKIEKLQKQFKKYQEGIGGSKEPPKVDKSKPTDLKTSSRKFSNAKQRAAVIPPSETNQVKGGDRTQSENKDTSKPAKTGFSKAAILAKIQKDHEDFEDMGKQLNDQIEQIKQSEQKEASPSFMDLIGSSLQHIPTLQESQQYGPKDALPRSQIESMPFHKVPLYNQPQQFSKFDESTLFFIFYF